VLLMGAACAFVREGAPLRVAYKHTDFPLHSRWKYLSCTDMIVCVSHAAAAAIGRAGIPASRYTVVHGASAIPDVRETARDDVRAEFRLSSSTRLLVAVANLRAPKGHADLVHALPHLVTTHRDWFLVIAGDGPERDRLTRLIAEHGIGGQVHLAGFRTDADQLLAAADLVVHPSRDEGLGLVLIQAQLLRKPVVATAVGGAAEVLDAGDPASCTAWIATPEDPADLARQIRSALDTIAAPPPDFAQRLDATAARMTGSFGMRMAAERLVALVAARSASR
jgi:glycosyltransferase involved in cell wall biosynthesis